jgi:long-chain fatty acid transport protein
MQRRAARVALAVAAIVVESGVCFANGVYLDGVGGRARGMAGADVADATDPLSALGENPAGLAFVDKLTLSLGGVAGFATGSIDRAGSSGTLRSDVKFGPETALGVPVGSTPLRFGFGIIPIANVGGTWRYPDPPGGLDGKTSYGLHDNESSITAVRIAAGFAAQITPQLSVGASAGMVYNENRLKTAYVFQSQPQLQGFKTQLDLATSGIGWNASAGVLFRPMETLCLGAVYTSRTVIVSDGDASGNASAQLNSLGGGFAKVDPDFHYDAKVKVVLPQTVSTGISIKARPDLRIALQVDWIDWSDAFDQLPVRLSNGSDRDLNAFVGSRSLNDNVPLRWQDRFVPRAGVEYAITPEFFLRGGYAYGRSPVPAATLMPLTAAIVEHTLSAGFGYRHDRYALDFAYQWGLPATQSVGTSDIRSGEYSGSKTTVSTHTFTLTSTVAF